MKATKSLYVVFFRMLGILLMLTVVLPLSVIQLCKPNEDLGMAYVLSGFYMVGAYPFLIAARFILPDTLPPGMSRVLIIGAHIAQSVILAGLYTTFIRWWRNRYGAGLKA